MNTPSQPIQFQESQKMNIWWLWLIMFIIFSLITYKLFIDQDHEFWIPFVGIILGILVLTILRFDTVIDSKGIHYKYRPFHLSFQTITWEAIDKIEVRNYKSIIEYGGWGIRGWKTNRSYTMSGNEGIQLYLKDKRKILIGTQRGSVVNELLSNLEY